MTRAARRTSRTLALAFAVGLAASIASVAPATAHTQVSPASPEPGSTVTTSPVTVALNTTEPVLDSGQRSIVVRGPGDQELYYGDGCAVVSNAMTVSSDVTLGEPGEYTVIWTLVAEDGHTQSSNDFEPFTFTWQPADGQDTVEGSPSIPTCGEEPPADATDDAVPGDGEADDSSGDSSESEAQSETPPADSGADTASDADDSDIAWLIAAAGVVFIVAAIVVMILVRRRMLADDDEQNDADTHDSDAHQGDAHDGDTYDGDAHDGDGGGPTRGGPPPTV